MADPNQEPARIKDEKLANKYKSKTKESSVLHMGVYDIEAAAEVRKSVHQKFVLSYNDPYALIACYEALMQFWIIFKFATAKSNRKMIDTLFDDFAKKRLPPIEMRLAKGVPLIQSEYTQTRHALSNIIEKVYMVKQLSGLGIPTEKVRDAETMLDDVMRG